ATTPLRRMTRTSSDPATDNHRDLATSPYRPDRLDAIHQERQSDCKVSGMPGASAPAAACASEGGGHRTSSPAPLPARPVRGAPRPFGVGWVLHPHPYLYTLSKSRMSRRAGHPEPPLRMDSGILPVSGSLHDQPVSPFPTGDRSPGQPPGSFRTVRLLS